MIIYELEKIKKKAVILNNISEMWIEICLYDVFHINFSYVYLQTMLLQLQ